jgi:hypothetical protein
MKHLSIALVFIAFFSLIGAACYFTTSAMPLWALLLAPTYKSKTNDSKDDE